jgi:3-deoxy-D-manno-octulosonate 8-phosphate phosphatase (KDO 8-P phosphatase)
LDKNPEHKLDADIEVRCAQFSAAGAVFVTPPAELAARLAEVRALVFDWDGVFNTGVKSQPSADGFSEADSMGTNMLRYGLWRATQRLPASALISGEHNPGAIEFAAREHFQDVYIGIRDKRLAIRHLCATYEIAPDQVACVFDDINDLGMAAMCGVRCLVRRRASPLLQHYVIERKLCDYATGNSADRYAVREVCELLLGLMGAFDSVVASRVDYDDRYQEYFAHRQAAATRTFVQRSGEIVEAAL